MQYPVTRTIFSSATVFCNLERLPKLRIGRQDWLLCNENPSIYQECLAKSVYS